MEPRGGSSERVKTSLTVDCRVTGVPLVTLRNVTEEDLAIDTVALRMAAFPSRERDAFPTTTVV